ncbi:condensation protein, partial [Streptomyces sp. SID3343]|nr:condensation protein [Streptomyces sp. SID3343]
MLEKLPSSFRLRAIDLAFRRPLGEPLPTGFLFDFEGTPPPVGALRARVAERGETVGALRYRVGRDGRHARRVDDVTFADHVREVDLPGDKDGARTGRLMVSEPFVRDGRPPWEVWLIRRGEGAYTLGFRADHVL